MAFTWALNDKYNDIIIGKTGKLAKIVGSSEVRQRVLISLRHYWQEYFLNVPAGMPWYELILGSKDKKQAELLIRDTVIKVPGVISIISLKYISSEERHVSFDMRIEVAGIDGPSIEEISFSLDLGYTNG